MRRYLFIFSITPVQGFIEQSRKTQDLYSGSAILSYLCRQAIMIVKEKWQGEIVFPNVKSRSLPNRFLAIVQEDTEENLKELGLALEKEIYKKLEEVFEYCLGIFGIPKPSGSWQQIKSYFHFYWVFDPMDAGYTQAYKTIESHLGQTKIRSFSPLREDGEENAH
ncbi:type III-B CRISPR-associated protein Cas10/Cmr2 [Dehalobacterium formicoaceticum]|uniref:CRISPR-associated protein Cmr2 N-terminal domain-containing protein n=1 Tax=Dehalobacterium formicoaceticum TaxID=51515 RepID=A0ABT1Y1I4_9FIRM|nr:type III-B CRISPR-associated protein Cas10/Cmr2 [Dehalobacterium formicoaceticum]MCR6544722.1 hypothetical protein [Dehalobacterium formicoaceticum]